MVLGRAVAVMRSRLSAHAAAARTVNPPSVQAYGRSSGLAGDAVAVAVELRVGGVVGRAAHDRRRPRGARGVAVGVDVPGSGRAAVVVARRADGGRGHL